MARPIAPGRSQARLRQLRAAYRQTIYWVDAPGRRIAIRIGRRSKALDGILAWPVGSKDLGTVEPAADHIALNSDLVDPACLEGRDELAVSNLVIHALLALEHIEDQEHEQAENQP